MARGFPNRAWWIQLDISWCWEGSGTASWCVPIRNTREYQEDYEEEGEDGEWDETRLIQCMIELRLLPVSRAQQHPPRVQGQQIDVGGLGGCVVGDLGDLLAPEVAQLDPILGGQGQGQGQGCESRHVLEHCDSIHLR